MSLNLFKRLEDAEAIDDKPSRVQEYKSIENKYAKRFKRAMVGTALASGLMMGSALESCADRTYHIIADRVDPGLTKLERDMVYAGMYLYALAAFTSICSIGMRSKVGRRLANELKTEKNIPGDMQEILNYHSQTPSFRHILGEKY